MDVMLWRRLDRPGHDACRLEPSERGWRLAGTAVFLDDDGPALLAYDVSCDRAWVTRGGSIRGWIGTREVTFEVVRDVDERWRLNGHVVAGLEACVDLDLGVTPATNLLPLRRLALAVGQRAEVSSAWLDVATGTLTQLDQSYARRSDRVYEYEAPRFDYSALLEVRPDGFVTLYPDLWEAASP